MKYQMELSEFPFNKIRFEGRKVDIRLFDKKRQSLKIGDIIEYINTNNPTERMECKVMGLAFFDNFDNLVDCLGPQMIGYADKREVLLRLNRAYALDEQRKFNVVAIFIRDISSAVREILRDSLERDAGGRE